MDLLDYYDHESQDKLYQERVQAQKSDSWVDNARGYAREGAGHIGHSIGAASSWAWDGASNAASDLWDGLF
jgi:hypothetical protein